MSTALVKFHDRVLPQSLEMEQAVLGACMIDREAAIYGATALRQSDFYRDVHGMVFAAICTLTEREEPVDILTLQEELRARNQLEKVGGAAYLTVLMDATPAAARINAYAAVVKEKALRRQMIAFADRAKGLAYTEDGGEISALIASIENELYSISRGTRGQLSKELLHISAYFADFVERMEAVEANGGTIQGIKTGYGTIDKKILAMEAGGLTVLGARPSTGKTALAMNIADHAASEGHTVAVFSMEMTGTQIYRRLLSARTQIPLKHIRQSKFDSAEQVRMGHGVNIINTQPIYLCESSTETVAGIGAKVRALSAQRKVDLVVIDYLGLMQFPGTDIRIGYGENARGLKQMAKDLGLSVLLLSQLSRLKASAPTMSDLKESGDIEAHADIVFLLHRTAQVVEDPDISKINVDVAKVRDGATGIVKMMFDGKCVRYFEEDEIH